MGRAATKFAWQGRYDEARAEYKKANELDPKGAPAALPKKDYLTVSRRRLERRLVINLADCRLVAWIGGVGALSPTRVSGYMMRMYSGRPSSSIRFSTSAAMATSVACRPSVCERSPSPMTRFQRAISDSTRARQPYPEARCQPMRPRSARHRRCVSRRVGAVSAVPLGTALG